jgi:hypothetical protein
MPTIIDTTSTRSTREDIPHTAPDGDVPDVTPPPSQEPARRKYRHVENSENFGYQPTPSHKLPRPGPWAERIIRGMVESIHGVRDPYQFSRWVSHDVFQDVTTQSQDIQRQNQTLGKRPLSPRFALQRLIIAAPRDGVIEASAVVGVSDRIKAVALRMEGMDNRWMATSFKLL